MSAVQPCIHHLIPSRVTTALIALTAVCTVVQTAAFCPAMPHTLRTFGWIGGTASPTAFPLCLRRGAQPLQSGFGEAADRIREEARAKEEAAKAAKKKKDAAKKIQEQVKKRMQAREKAAAEKQKAAQEELQQRSEAQARRERVAAKRREKEAAAGLHTGMGADVRPSDSDVEEWHSVEKLPLSDAAHAIMQNIAQRKAETQTLRILALMDAVATLEPAHDRAETASAVVQALLQCGRAALALQAAQRAEREGHPLPAKLLVSVAKAVSLERPRVPRAKKPGRIRGQKAAAARVLVGDSHGNEEGEAADEEGIGRCLDVACMLEARGEVKEAGAIARVYAAAVSGLLRQGRLRAAKDRLSALRQLPGSLSLGAYKSLARDFARLQSLQGVLDVLDLMRHFGVEPDAEVLELVANVAVHDVSFVKGAVSMETLPEADIPEACFAGRSNVGKSSLVNMICNRKKLAFTSKTPGKTQEFNYFLVSGGRAVGGPADKNVFHLVDLPGVGYAEVPTFKREEWKQFYRDYLSQRSALRVLFQLVDGRHGPLKDDSDLMTLVGNPLPTHHASACVCTILLGGGSRVGRQVILHARALGDKQEVADERGARGAGDGGEAGAKRHGWIQPR